MKVYKKFCMLLSVFIILGLLLGTFLNPAYAQDTVEENAAAQISLSGWFSIIWGDSEDGKSSNIYTLTDVDGQQTSLQLDETVVKKLGGVLQFNDKYISVQGTLATPSYTDATSIEAAPGSTQSPSAVLNVISISLAPPPESQAPTINDVTAGLGADVTADVTALGVSGSKPWVTIMCKFSDITNEPNDYTYFLEMYGDTKPGLNHYWQELSFNTIDINGSTVAGTGWYTLPETELYYNPNDTGQGTDLTALANDCIAVADADVDFSLYSGINMMFNSDFDNGWAWGGGWNGTLDGVTRSWSITWEPPWAYGNISVIAHEMGHGFGLPHSTAIDRTAVYDNAWDVMSWDRYNCAAANDPTYGCIAQHTISYHKDLLGWIPGARIITIATGTIATVTLEDLAAPASTNYQIVKIPIGGSATNFYTVEARRFTGYDVKLPGEAVIIHNVDKTNGMPAVLVPEGVSSVHPDVRWTPGEIFHDAINNITVVVNSATATGFVMTISNNSNLPPISEAGGPYTQQCMGTTTSVALDGTGSIDPEGFPLTYSWSTSCDGTFNSSTIAQPILTVNTSPGCLVNCTVSLIVTDNLCLSSCSDSATVTIRDTTPPTIVCPADSTIQCDASSAPSNTGYATVMDSCTPILTVTYADVTTPGSCPQASTITRTWATVDNCGNTSSCVQSINVVDTTPPTIITTPVTYTVCVPNAAVVTIQTPVISDNCTDNATIIIEGFVKSINAQEANMVPIVSSEAILPVGEHIIEWRATDNCGNQTIAEQVIYVEFIASEDCCGSGKNLFIGDNGQNFLYNYILNPGFMGPPWCALTYGGDDVVNINNEPENYVALGEGNDNTTLSNITGGKNIVIGEGGNDHIKTSFSDDNIYGGHGNDYITSDGGNNIIYGSFGNDIIYGGFDSDIIIPGPGQDIVYGSFGDDTVYVYDVCELEFGEILSGESGNDTLYLPVTLAEASSLGISISGFEHVFIIDPSKKGFSECVSP